MPYFYATITDPVSGKVLIDDVECEISASVDISSGNAVITIQKITINHLDLVKGGMLARMLHAAILEQAETEISAFGSLYDRILDEAGVTFIGNPADPDARGFVYG